MQLCASLVSPLQSLAAGARGALAALLLLPAILLAKPPAAVALDRVVLERNGQRHEVIGQVQTRLSNGGLLLLASDGVLWSVEHTELIEHTTDEAPLEPLTPLELTAELLDDFPGFHVHATQHYLICYNTSDAYAQWCGALFERLYLAFTNYWTRRGFELEEPRFPLVAVVFADRASFSAHAAPELGDATGSIIGYYSLQSNRMTTYDLTGEQALRQPGDRRGSSAEINRLLSRPGAERTVATIVHEATHQIAFNCGMHARYADIPLWVSEGLAIYFETPDLRSSSGWRGLGDVNRVRLAGFRNYAPRRPADSLHTLLADDQRFRNARSAIDAYAEAWALNYFLIRQKPREYQEYQRQLSAKGPLLRDSPQERLSQFQAAFGEDLSQLDREFMLYMSRVR